MKAMLTMQTRYLRMEGQRQEDGLHGIYTVGPGYNEHF